MIFQINYNNEDYFLDFDSGVDLSIRNNFSDDAPVFFGSDTPKIDYLKTENFHGQVSEGGSCNVPIVTLNTHCTGTHTESISHVDDSEVSVVDMCPKGFIPTNLITVRPKKFQNTNDSYHIFSSNDMAITKECLEKKIKTSSEGLIIRTLPNKESKKLRNYDLEPASFLTNEALDHIISIGVKHLLVDIPSVDRFDDGGRLENHKKFFNSGKTISEFLFIPEFVEDGFGFLQIQIPSWGLDAAPSRPIFYPA